MTVKLYVEGAGHTDLERTQCRQAFGEFFRSAGLAGKRPRTVPCGARQSAYEAFVTAVSNAKSDELPLLLVDAEEAVKPQHTAWQHLHTRDGWTRPSGASDDQAFLMVQVMETWFLADRRMLREHFGPAFRDDALKEWPALEAVPRETVLQALDRATARCSTRYAKGRVCFELLARLDSAQVEALCPHAGRLLQRLRSL